MADVVDAEIVEETPEQKRLDGEMGERAANVASIFADEPKSIDLIREEAFKTYGYGPNLVNICLDWLLNHGLASKKFRGGVVHWGKPIDVRRIVDAAAGVAEVMSHPVEAMGGEKAARVMREAAATARAVPAAVEGIKKEAKPALDAFSRLTNAAKEAGIFRVRDPIDVNATIAKKEKKP
jgi:hypothetical protein